MPTLPDVAPTRGYLWVGIARTRFEMHGVALQAALQRWTGGTLVDLHVSDLLNAQLPSNFDYTSLYDLLVFRRLEAAGGTADGGAAAGNGIVLSSKASARDGNGSGKGAANGQGDAAMSCDEAVQPLTRIETRAVGFAVFDRVLLTVHSSACEVRDFFANRLQQQAQASELRSTTRMPPNPADLALRMVNHMVDGYLELRRLLTRQLDRLQQELFRPDADYSSWKLLLDSRNSLHLLEDTCEDQRSAITEWIDAYDELPDVEDPGLMRERELLRVRARDVLEHIERVLSHVRRLEASAENAVQMHFSAQSNRTNEIMRTLTVLTAIFLPLNLVTGFFGMNFEGLPLIHSARGFWWTFLFMLAIGCGLSWYFWRKRYLDRSE